MQQSEKALYLLAQTGDTEAEERLLMQHTPLIHALSSRFPAWKEDAFQAGCMALIYAVRHFDPDKGFCFSTYAVPHILGAMKKAGAEKIPWRTRAIMGKIRRVQERTVRDEMRSATMDEMACAAGVDRAEVALLLEMGSHAAKDSESDLMSYADPGSETWMDSFLLRDLISRLSPRERRLIHLRYGEGRNQKEAACIMHTSQSGISRMEHKIRETLLCEWME